MQLYDPESVDIVFTQYKKYKKTNADGEHLAADGTYMPLASWRELEKTVKDIMHSADLALRGFEALYSLKSDAVEFMECYISDEARQNTKAFLEAAARHNPKYQDRVAALFDGKTAQ